MEKRKFNFFFISIPLLFFLKKEIGKGKKTEKKREKEKKEENKERAGYSASKLRNNQPSKNFYGVDWCVGPIIPPRSAQMFAKSRAIDSLTIGKADFSFEIYI